MSALTGRTRVRIDWRGRVILQVEMLERLDLLCGFRLSRFGEPDRRPTNPIWRDATQQDLNSLVPPFLEAPSIEPVSG